MNKMDLPDDYYGKEVDLNEAELDWSNVGWPPIVDNPTPTKKPKASKGGLPGHDDFYNSEDAEFIDFDSMDPFEERFGNKQSRRATKRTVAKKKRARSTSSVTASEPGSMSFSSEPEETSGSEYTGDDSEETARSEDNEEDGSEDDSTSNEDDSDEDDSEDESEEDDSDMDDDDTSGSDDDSDDSDDSDDDDDSDDEDSDDDDSDDEDSDDDDSDDEDSDSDLDESRGSEDSDEAPQPATNQSNTTAFSNDWNDVKSYSSMNSRGLGHKVNDFQNARSLAVNLAQKFVSKNSQGLFPVISAALFGGAMAYLPTATQSLMGSSLPKVSPYEQLPTASNYPIPRQLEISSLFSDWFSSPKTLRKMK